MKQKIPPASLLWKKTPRNKKIFMTHQINRKVALLRALTANSWLNSILGVWVLLRKKNWTFFSACYLKANFDIKEIFHQDTCVRVCVHLHKNIITNTKFLPKKIKTPLKQWNFPTITSPENMEKFWRLSSMKENPYPLWFRRAEIPIFLFNSPRFCVLSIGENLTANVTNTAADMFVIYEKHFQITYLVYMTGK